jgi:hypothetical protein
MVPLKASSATALRRGSSGSCRIAVVRGTPKGRTAGARYLGAFVEDVKASGFVADAAQAQQPVSRGCAAAGAVTSAGVGKAFRDARKESVDNKYVRTY